METVDFGQHVLGQVHGLVGVEDATGGDVHHEVEALLLGHVVGGVEDHGDHILAQLHFVLFHLAQEVAGLLVQFLLLADEGQLLFIRGLGALQFLGRLLQGFALLFQSGTLFAVLAFHLLFGGLGRFALGGDSLHVHDADLGGSSSAAYRTAVDGSGEYSGDGAAARS